MSGDVKRCRGIHVANRPPRSTNGVDEIGAQVALRGTVFPPTADLGGLFGRWAPFSDLPRKVTSRWTHSALLLFQGTKERNNSHESDPRAAEHSYHFGFIQ